MREVIPFMALMKEVYFIFDIHLPKPEVIVKYSNTIKVVFMSRGLTNYHQEQIISLLSIIISRDSYKRRLCRYDILVHDTKKWTFSPNHLTKHYLSIYNENDLYGDLNI